MSARKFGYGVAVVLVVAIGVCLLIASYLIHTALAADFRSSLWGPVFGVQAGLAVICLWLARFARLFAVVSGFAVAAFLLLAGREALFQVDRFAVLEADPAQLERVGAHFIVGYRDVAELERWVELRAIGGIYVTRRNLRGITPGRFAQRMKRLQGVRQAQGLPPLVIVADQEGGIVAHLSPPLPRSSSLARVLNRCRRRTKDAGTDDGGLSAACLSKLRDHGARHGRDLRSLGVNLNLAPVVDLKHKQQVDFDVFSHISRRAIHRDPEIVAAGAAYYCAGLAATGVGCTAKHFPGLGLSKRDAHFFLDTLEVSRETLENSEWVPFRQLARFPDLPLAIMVSHIEIPAVEADLPSSRSAVLLQEILREQWSYDGLLLSDDFSMFPVSESWGGIGDATVAALQNGMDFVLISYDTDLYYRAMAAALRANAAGELTDATLAASITRMMKFFKRLHVARGLRYMEVPSLGL